MSAAVEDRFFSFVAEQENGCWLWTGKPDTQGYAYFYSGAGRTPRGHSWAYRHFVGEVPSGLHLDHICHSFDEDCAGGKCAHRLCVNSAHLEPVTPLENTRRGRGHGKETHCPGGHEYTDSNTYRRAGRRQCKACRDARNAAFPPSARTPRPDRHGHMTNYSYGCRCDPCKAAARAYQQAYRARRAAA